MTVPMNRVGFVSVCWPTSSAPTPSSGVSVPVPSIYSIVPPNDGSALRHGHHFEPVDFVIDHGRGHHDAYSAGSCQRTYARACGCRQRPRTAEKIRRYDQVCGNLQVSIATDSFDTAAPQYTTAASAAFLTPTDDSRVIVAAALRIFERLWREGFAYRKAGVILLDLSPAGDAVGSLFDDGPLENSRLMQALDRINGRFGRGSIGLGLTARTAEWRMRQERLSPRYTTRWRDLAAASTGPIPPYAEAAKSNIPPL